MPVGNGGLTSQILTKPSADAHTLHNSNNNNSAAFIKEDIVHMGGSNMDNNLA